jgi:hypothetical protein
MKYLSDQLIERMKADGHTHPKLCDEVALRKLIRGFFIRVHEDAVDSTLIAKNKKNFERPNFDDQI